MNGIRIRPGLTILLMSSLSTLLPGAASGGAWVLPRDQNWIDFHFAYQQTDERYFLDGERTPYFFEGLNRTRAVYANWMRGLGSGLEFQVQLPFFNLRFDDLADQRSSTGIGDLRAGLRWNFIEAPLVATASSTIKFPTGEFNNDAEVVPVGEGQYDIEINLELARSLWPRPAYITGLVGYRFRMENQETNIDHGDEILWWVEGGYRLGTHVLVKGVLRGLYGLESTSFGLELDSLRREAMYLEPAVVFLLNEKSGIEIKTPVTLRGRNWPAGQVIDVGYYLEF